MGSSRYQRMFTQARSEGRGVFVPFVVVGDPDIETSISIMCTLAAAGADALELGIPFSDPVADGPTIQAAAVRALDAGATPPGCFAAIARVRGEFPNLPMGILTYANTVFSPGPDAFYRAAQESGIDSVLIADLPIFEGKEYTEIAAKHGIDQVFIAPPGATQESLRGIASMSRGYTYVVARAGVTGANDEVQTDFSSLLHDLRELGAPPSLIGFGISRPEHVRTVLDAGADGAISGSAVVNVVHNHLSNTPEMLEALGAFVRSMRNATKHS